MPDDPVVVDLAARKEARARLERYGKTIGTVDGTNRDELRQWIERVDHAREWTASGDRDLLEMVGYLITGSLASHVRRFVKAREGVTWAQVKTSITDTFLDLNEGRVLRQHVEKFNQRAFEDPREYGLRFDEAVQMAYTAEQQAVDVVQEHLVHLFIHGLRNKAVRQQVHLGSPKTLADAITLAITTAGAFELADEDRKEEPMEIGAMGPARPIVPQLAEVQDSLAALRREMATLRERLDGSTYRGNGRGRGRFGHGRGGQNNRPPGRPLRPPPDHSGITCYRCGQQGHIQRNCQREGAQRLSKLEAAIASLQLATGAPTQMQENSRGHQTNGSI